MYLNWFLIIFWHIIKSKREKSASVASSQCKQSQSILFFHQQGSKQILTSMLFTPNSCRPPDSAHELWSDIQNFWMVFSKTYTNENPCWSPSTNWISEELMCFSLQHTNTTCLPFATDAVCIILPTAVTRLGCCCRLEKYFSVFSPNEFCLLPLLLSEWKNIKFGSENAIESVDKLSGSVQLIVFLLAMAYVLLDC